MKILYAASEAAPFVKTGGLADVAGSLPKALNEAGAQTRVILPLYSAIDLKWRERMTFLFHIDVKLSWRRQYCGVFCLEHDGVTYYFVDNEYYFKRDSIYGCFDDGERFGFFSRAVVEAIPRLGWTPDIIHCNDWQTALVPIYLRYESADVYRSIKSVFTIHNIEYQGRFGPATAEDVFALPQELCDSGIIWYENDVNLMKGAIYESDSVTTVSPSYADELQNPDFANGLHAVVESNSYKLSGILNGIDTVRYDPAKDPLLAKNYSAADLSGKSVCKAELCRELGLSDEPGTPIIACISRLVEHKGFALITEALDEIIAKGARLVIIGTGEEKLENFFCDAENRYRGSVSASIMYSESRAMRIYAGSDMLLMPSRSEPCGLSQMIAMRYGTVPIVREVGGLKDTVRNLGGENANGFSFREYSASGLLGAVDFALRTYRGDPATWRLIMLSDMTADLSWSSSAVSYINIYKRLMGN